LDRNIPPELVERAAPHLGDSKVQILPGVTHACCWEASWHVILADH
jgi:hypothetical protein